MIGEHRFINPLSSFRWYPNAEVYDVFLYWKSWTIIITGVLMFIILVYLHKYIPLDKTDIPPFYPMFIYGIFVVLSAINSEFTYFCLHGAPEHFESLFVLLAYIIILFYTYISVQSEQHIKLIMTLLYISTIIICIIGLTQFLGADIYEKIFNNKGYYFNFEKTRVYGTFYNPNYVGSYTALIIPFFITGILYPVSKVKKIPIIIIIAGLFLCLFGSKSTAGFVAISISFILLLLFLRKLLVKYWKISIGTAVCILLFIVAFQTPLQNIYINKIKSSFLNQQEPVINIESIKTNDDNIEIIYKGNTFQVTFEVLDEAESKFAFEIYDKEGNEIESTINEENSTIYLIDARFEGITVAPVVINDLGGILCFSISIDGKDWYFTNQANDSSYYYVNKAGKLDKMHAAPSAIFTNMGTFASRRGYIWSRTIPLLKDYFLIGSGPDTFSAVYPNDDYIAAYYYGYENIYISKPHNIYLQIAVQTGVLSLIMWLIFYVLYFVKSVRLYWSSKLNSSLELTGLGLFIGTLGYMFAGLINDSSITAAPFYWVCLGLGMGINKRVHILKNKSK